MSDLADLKIKNEPAKDLKSPHAAVHITLNPGQRIKEIAFLSVANPCGNKLVLRCGDKIPHKNIKCPCGVPDCWLFRIDRVKA